MPTLTASVTAHGCGGWQTS